MAKFRERQRGQATFEYSIVIFYCVMILILPLGDPESPIVRLANALKGFYNAFAFALSFSSTITPL